MLATTTLLFALGLPPAQAQTTPPLSTPAPATVAQENAAKDAAAPAAAPPLPAPTAPSAATPPPAPPSATALETPATAGYAAPIPPSALPESEKSPPEPYSVRVMVQLRYQQTDVSVLPGLEALVRGQYPSPAVASETLRSIRDTAREQDGLRVRRAFLRFEVNPAKHLRGKALLDFARLLYEEDKTQMVRALFAEFEPMDRLEFRLGIVKVPFSLFERVHAAELEIAEKGPSHELLHRLKLAGPEVGAMVKVTPLPKKRWLHIYGGVLDAGALGGQTSRGPGLLALRLLSRPIDHLELAAGLVARPQAADAWWEELRFRYQDYEKGIAYSADAVVSINPVVIRAEWLAGDRTDNDVLVPLKQRRGDARTFMSLWGMVTARFPVSTLHLMPALRAEWLDTDREHADVGSIFHLSGAINVDFSERMRVMFDLSRHFVQYGTRNWMFDIVRYDTDYTTGTLQFQLRL